MSNTARRLVPVAAQPKVILPYERVSALMGRDDEAFRSPEIQRKANLANIHNAGHVVYQDALDHPELYRDIDRTGRDFNREGIQRALDLKRRGLIDGISVLDVSRVGRTTGETLEVIELFRSESGIFLSSREHIEDSPTGEFMLSIVVAMAQMYSDNIALGWRAVIEDRAANGLHNGTPPLGYDFERDELGQTIKPTRIVLDERKAPIVREAFQRYAKGESMTSIAKWLRAQGLRSTKSARPLLENPFYLGDVRLRVYTGKAKKRVAVKDAPPMVVQGKGRHPILLADKHGNADRELFERVQTRLEAERYIARRHKTPVHALAGLVHCANCDRALTARFMSGQRYLTDHNGRAAGCVGAGAATTVSAEAAVLEEIRQLVQGFQIGVGEQVAQLRSRETLRAERDAMEAQLVQLDKSLADADHALYVTGKLTQARYDVLTQRIEDERAMVAARLAERELDEAGPDELTVVEAARELFERWETATPAERNVMLKACGVRKVKIRDTRRWREPVADRIEVVFAM